MHDPEEPAKHHSVPGTLGVLIELLAEKRQEISCLNAQLKILKDHEKDLESNILCEMEAQGTQSASSSKGTVRVNTSTVPSVTDWDAFYEYIHQTQSYYLLERRPAAIPYRELLNTGGEIPGVVPFVRRTLTLTVKH